ERDERSAVLTPGGRLVLGQPAALGTHAWKPADWFSAELVDLLAASLRAAVAGRWPFAHGGSSSAFSRLVFPSVRRRCPEAKGPSAYDRSMTEHARAERHALADLLMAVGPDAPTLCAGWTTAHLAAHLVVR